MQTLPVSQRAFLFSPFDAGWTNPHMKTTSAVVLSLKGRPNEAYRA